MNIQSLDQEKFQLSLLVDTTSECWLWTGRKTRGYGVISISGKECYAHRVSHELWNGTVPDDLCVLHKCDTPPCVNPDHLELGDRAKNNSDAAARGLTAKGDKNGMRKHPERHARGDRHGSKTHPESVVRGSRHPLAKLTDEQMAQIADLCSKKIPQSKIAMMFGVGQATISRIRNGKERIK